MSADERDTIFNQVTNFNREGNYQEIIDLLDPFVKTNPDDGVALRDLAGALVMIRRFDEAIPFYKRFIAWLINSNEPNRDQLVIHYHLVLAYCTLQAKDADETDRQLHWLETFRNDNAELQHLKDLLEDLRKQLKREAN